MKPFKFAALVAGLLLATALVAPRPARAQVGAGMPDISDFAPAIARTAEDAPPPKATKGPFATGLDVPKVKPGASATALVQQIRKTLKDTYGDKMDPQFVAAWADIESSMPKMMVAMDSEMSKNGYKPRDMGVAYGLTLTTLFEVANDKKLPDTANDNASKILALAFAKQYGEKFKKLAPGDKEKAYETLLALAMLGAVMADALKQADKTDELRGVRDSSNALFQKLIGVPATQVEISDDGHISGLAPDAK